MEFVVEEPQIKYSFCLRDSVGVLLIWDKICDLGTCLADVPICIIVMYLYKVNYTILKRNYYFNTLQELTDYPECISIAFQFLKSLFIINKQQLDLLTKIIGFPKREQRME